MKIIIPILIFFAAVVLQTTLVQFASIFHILPNLVLAVGISWAILRSYKETVLCGLFAGIMLDMLSGREFGIKTISLIIILIGVNLLAKEFLSGPRILLLTSLSFAGTIFYGLMNFCLLNLIFHLKLINFKPDLIWHLLLGQGVYNVFLVFLVFWILSKIDKWLLYYSKQVKLSR